MKSHLSRYILYDQSKLKSLKEKFRMILCLALIRMVNFDEKDHHLSFHIHGCLYCVMVKMVCEFNNNWQGFGFSETFLFMHHRRQKPINSWECFHGKRYILLCNTYSYRYKFSNNFNSPSPSCSPQIFQNMFSAIRFILSPRYIPRYFWYRVFFSRVSP